MNAQHPNLVDWQADPALAALWVDTWRQPHMQKGLAVLLNWGLPKAQTILPGVDAIALQALKGSRDAGYFDFARNIEALKEPPKLSSTQVPGTNWGEASLEQPPPEIVVGSVGQKKTSRRKTKQ